MFISCLQIKNMFPKIVLYKNNTNILINLYTCFLNKYIWYWAHIKGTIDDMCLYNLKKWTVMKKNSCLFII